MGAGDEGTCTDLAHLPLSPSPVTLTRRGWMAFSHWAMAAQGQYQLLEWRGSFPGVSSGWTGGLSVVHSGVFPAPVQRMRPREEQFLPAWPQWVKLVKIVGCPLFGAVINWELVGGILGSLSRATFPLPCLTLCALRGACSLPSQSLPTTL